MTLEEQYKLLDLISEIICKKYKKEEGFLFIDTRRREVSDLRKIFFYMSKKFTKLSLQTIGNYSEYRGRKKPHNHASILYSVEKVSDWMSIDKKYKEEIEDLTNEIRYYVDYEQYILDELNHFKKNIVKKIYQEKDRFFIEKVSNITDNIYENRNLIDKLADIIEEVVKIQKDNNEGLHKTTQEDTGLGVV
jgi:hypothetical protein